HQGRSPSSVESEAFIKFARDASTAIKEVAPGQLVSTGLVNTVHVTAEDPLQYGLRLYGLPTLDAVSIHYYHHDDEKQRAAKEIEIAKRLRKPFYVGEFGADRSDAKSKGLDRAKYVRDEMADWRQKGAAAALVWAFNCSPHDLGISDTRAWARMHGDFDTIASAVKDFAPPANAVLIPRPSDVTSPRDGTGHAGTQGQAQKLFVVVDPPITIRSEHNTAKKYAVGRFELNDRFFADAEPFNDGRIVWRHHAQGWSAECQVGARPQVWIVEESLDLAQRHDDPELTLPDGTLLAMPPLLGRLPIALDDQTWTQYFGNTRFAYGLQSRKSRAVRGMYDYCQGLHGGIDFGVQAIGKTIFAGLSDGIVSKVDDSGKVYNPGYARVKIGMFNVTFGHMRNIAVKEGDRISAGTVMGETGDITFKDGSKGEPHLHFEIRMVHERVTYVVNPLLFIPPYLRHQYTRKFPSYARHFHFSDAWTQWLTPLDQPALKLCNPGEVVIIGPRAVDMATP
ncbi:MAG: M23 family metallopeptidase, partial [Anaerolineae bacterium]|nr:M23 family metallopeptidase [Anaerolineae bacterium]